MLLWCVVKSKFVYSKKQTMIFVMQACENSQNCDNHVTLTRGQRRELKVIQTTKRKCQQKPAKFDKDIFPSVLISNQSQMCAMWGAQWPEPWPVTRRHWPRASCLSPQLWPDSHKAHISSHRAQQLRENEWIARFPCVSGAYKKFILIGSAFDD